jgi:hypothetical protein
MSLLFSDSFDHYATADILLKYSTHSGGASQSISAGTGRRGTASWRVSATNRSLGRTVTAGATKIIGFSFQCGGLPAATATIAALMEGATDHITLRIGTGGALIVARNTTQLGISAAGVIGAGTTNYIELKGKVDNTTGTTEVHLNGAAVSGLTLTGQDTQNAGTATCNNVELRGYASQILDYDDFYICDDSGGAPCNDFLGDVRVDWSATDGNGAINQYARSSGAANYEMVGDATPDGDSTYVYDSIPNRQELYTVANMAHTPLTIFGIQAIASARKSDAGNRTHQPLVRSGTTIYPASSVNLSTAYLMYMDVRQVDPDTGVAWTQSGVNAVQVGSEVD